MTSLGPLAKASPARRRLSPSAHECRDRSGSGMNDSHWVNQHGLHDEQQYTSVHDLAILHPEALRHDFPQYADYFSIEGLLSDGKELPSHNNLLAALRRRRRHEDRLHLPGRLQSVSPSATRNGRTLMAIVVGGETIEARDEEARRPVVARVCFRAGHRADNCRTQADRNRAQRAGQHDRPALLEEGSRARAKKYKELVAAVKAGKAVMPQPIYSADLPRPRRLVPIQLGGAQRPAAKAMAAAEELADVPIPTWRPDMPVPGLRTRGTGRRQHGLATVSALPHFRSQPELPQACP